MLRRHRRRRATTAVPGFATGGRTGSRPTRPRPLLCSSASNCENELEVGTAAQLGETERELLLRTDAEVAIGCWSQSAPEISAIFFFPPPARAKPSRRTMRRAPLHRELKRNGTLRPTVSDPVPTHGRDRSTVATPLDLAAASAQNEPSRVAVTRQRLCRCTSHAERRRN